VLQGAATTRDVTEAMRVMRRRAGEEHRATALELFFDLVLVFAVTQLSRYLLHHLTVQGAARTLFLLLVVWWAWIYTTWTTNWFAPDSVAVRLTLVAGMLASLVMAIALPQASGSRALPFILGYVGLQIMRNAFIGHPSEPRRDDLSPRFHRARASARVGERGGEAGQPCGLRRARSAASTSTTT
jgi:low temperature requirement protein LtrA